MHLKWQTNDFFSPSFFFKVTWQQEIFELLSHFLYYLTFVFIKKPATFPTLNFFAAPFKICQDLESHKVSKSICDFMSLSPIYLVYE